MRTETGTVEVTVGNQKFTGPLTKQVFETTDDVLQFLQKPETAKEVIDHINYSIDLGERAKVRAQVLARPEVANFATLEKQVKDLMKTRAANGKPITEEQARKMLELLNSMDASSV